MRDVETDYLLLRLRALFNGSAWADLDRHRLLMSDWLEERGRPEEAGYLRSGKWMVLIHEGQGWPTPCTVVGRYATGTSRHIYIDSDWIAAEQEVQAASREGDWARAQCALQSIAPPQ